MRQWQRCHDYIVAIQDAMEACAQAATASGNDITIDYTVCDPEFTAATEETCASIDGEAEKYVYAHISYVTCLILLLTSLTKIHFHLLSVGVSVSGHAATLDCHDALGFEPISIKIASPAPECLDAATCGVSE